MCLQDSKKHQTKKVRFAEDVLELPMENKSDPINMAKAQVKDKCREKLNDIMPPNRAALYRGIMKYRALKGGLDF